MEKRINAAAIALPKLQPLISAFVAQHQQYAEVQCVDEELFYDPKNGDIFIALNFLLIKGKESEEKLLVVRAPGVGRPEISSIETLLASTLDDITHIIPNSIRQVLKNQYLHAQVRTALQTSLLLNNTCEDVFQEHRIRLRSSVRLKVKV